MLRVTEVRADLDAGVPDGSIIGSRCTHEVLRAQLQHAWLIHCLAAQLRIHTRLEWVPKWAIQHLAVI